MKPLLFSALGLGAIIAIPVACSYETEAQRQLRYEGWCKVYGLTNVTIAQWDALRSGGLLPGQAEREQLKRIETMQAINIGLSAGAAAGSK